MENHDDNVIGVTNEPGHYNFWCSGCGNAHHIYTVADDNGNYYSFNGNLLRPTFHYINRKNIGYETDLYYGYTETTPVGAPPGTRKSYCRFDITDGIISYHKTCSHIFAGLSLQMLSRRDWGGMRFTKSEDDPGYDVEFKE